MSLKFRLGLILGGLLVGLIAALAVVRQLEHRQARQLLADATSSRTTLLGHWIDRTSRSLETFVTDLARHRELAVWVRRRDESWAERELPPLLDRVDLDALWIATSDGTLLRSVHRPSQPALVTPPWTAAEFAALIRTARPHYFARLGAALVEISGRALVPPEGTAEAGTQPAGWIFAGRVWNETRLATLAALTDARVSLEPPGAIAPESSGDRTVVQRLLRNSDGQPLQALRVEHAVPGLALRGETDAWQTRVFIAFGLLVVLAVALSVRLWVLHPLDAIGESLARDDPAPIQPLRPQRDEFGRIARLMNSEFTQREALRRSEDSLRHALEERTRLGRDLHDGVIQSLYAAGMGLAGVRALLQPDQLEAATRLEQTRAALNETIHDVRNFIVGLEPEALKQQSFSHALAKLLEFVQATRPVRTTIEIDEELAAHLTLAQRVHALQIAREAVSNALRHGHAQQVRLTLRRAGYMTEFEIADDGQGFSPEHAPTSGHGLANLAERARELGAELTVHSEPGRGTRMKLVFAQSTLP